MAHLSTIKLLREWARWGEAHNVSYPSRASFFGERALKMPLFGIGHIPDDIMAAEQAVCRMDWFSRRVIILRYQRHLGFRALGVKLDCNWRTARKRLQQAEDEAHHELRNISRLRVSQTCRIGQDKIAVTPGSLA